MELKKQPGIVLGTMSKLGITSRLTATLTLYAAVSLFLMIALLTVPWLVIAGAMLAALVFDFRRAACRRKAERADAALEQTSAELPIW